MLHTVLPRRRAACRHSGTSCWSHLQVSFAQVLPLTCSVDAFLCLSILAPDRRRPLHVPMHVVKLSESYVHNNTYPSASGLLSRQPRDCFSSFFADIVSRRTRQRIIVSDSQPLLGHLWSQPFAPFVLAIAYNARNVRVDSTLSLL